MYQQTIETIGGCSPAIGMRATFRRLKPLAPTAAAFVLAVSAAGAAIAATPTAPNTGTQNVNVVNTPNVNVTTLPPVTLSGTPTVKATLTNALVNSLDLERVNRIPYESTQQPQPGCPATNGPAQCVFNFTPPPAGWRLVVENVSGIVTLAPGTTVPPVGFLTDQDGINFTNWGFTGKVGQANGSGPLASFNEPIHAVIDSGDVQSPIVGVVANWFSGVGQYMTLSGYLENCALSNCPPKVH
jgi:hypothetical protein